jgi:hypothetical protein
VKIVPLPVVREMRPLMGCRAWLCISSNFTVGSFEIAFQAAGLGTLWYVDRNNIGHDTGIKMAAGTSPAIAELDNGHAEIVFKRDSDGLLWRLDPGFDLRFAANGLGVAAGTSPSITAQDNGRFAIAFQAAGFGDLWTVDSDNLGRDTGLTMQLGTSPSINLDCTGCDILQ